MATMDICNRGFDGQWAQILGLIWIFLGGFGVFCYRCQFGDGENGCVGVWWQIGWVVNFLWLEWFCASKIFWVVQLFMTIPIEASWGDGFCIDDSKDCGSRFGAPCNSESMDEIES